jgi:hypothetical protein
MSRIKLSVLGALTALAVSAVVASSASAAFTLLQTACTAGTTAINLCWETTAEPGLKELEGEEEFTILLDEGETLLKGTLGTSEAHITCTDAHGVGTVSQVPLEDYQVKALVLSFTGCALLETLALTCKVPTTIPTESIKGEPVTDTSPPVLSEEAITFSPTAGTVFAEILFSNVSGKTCAFNNIKEKVEGTQQCLWIEPLTDLAEHLVHCLESESLLKFGGANAAAFELLSVVKPNNLGDLWDLEEVL